jgi:hypothetical protein
MANMIDLGGGVVSRLATAGFWVVVAAVFVFPYTATAHHLLYPFDFPLATVALLLLFAWRGPGRPLVRLGVPRRAAAVLATAVTLVVLYPVCRWLLVERIAAGAGLSVTPDEALAVPRWFCQALNEEMLLGFLPLVALHRRFGRPAAVAVGLAALFAVLHVGLYRAGDLQVWLRPQTVWALLAVGVLRNALILRAGHVGYAWAVHTAWNLAMFAGPWRQGPEGPSLSEPEIFDVFLGHQMVVGIVTLAALAALALLIGKGASPSVTKSPPAPLSGQGDTP